MVILSYEHTKIGNKLSPQKQEYYSYYNFNKVIAIQKTGKRISATLSPVILNNLNQ